MFRLDPFSPLSAGPAGRDTVDALQASISSRALQLPVQQFSLLSPTGGLVT